MAAPILGLGPLLATVYTVFFDILPHYHTAWSKWTRGAVMYYDDGGNPHAEPHLVRGLVTERGVCEATAAGLRGLYPERAGPDTGSAGNPTAR